MTQYQHLWWVQTRADYEILQLLRERAERPSHQLHYLQMVTEKLGKAYLWRGGNAPAMDHASFVLFLQLLGTRPQNERPRVAACFGFKRFDDLRSWLRAAIPLGHAIQRLAPTLAGSGPNPEYPWPHGAPVHAPATHTFEIWPQLVGTTRGRELLRFVDIAVARFPDYC